MQTLGHDSKGRKKSLGTIPKVKKLYVSIILMTTIGRVPSVSASLAQLVARRSHNPKVVSSILTGPIFILSQTNFEVSEDQKNEKAASAGNRTRVTTMATLYSTTRPLMLRAYVTSS